MTTTNNFIDHLLNETRLEENPQVQHVTDNENMSETGKDHKESMDILDEDMNPSQESIDIIMNYSALTKSLQK